LKAMNGHGREHLDGTRPSTSLLLHAEPAGQDVVRLYNQGGHAFHVA